MTSRDSKPGTSATRGAAAGPVYEQPLNERMRTFLRLDFLYQQALFHEEREDPWSTRAAVGSLLEILAITARGDARSEVLKELERQMAVMNDYQARPGVDTGRLRAVLSNLERLRTELNSAGALFMQKLRDSEFLNAIKHRSTIPGGTCEFDLPDYRHWLDQPFTVRAANYGEWMTTIRPLCDAVIELLWLTRETARPRPETAVGGNFQLAFERDSPSQLLRIALPAGTDLFPEVSGGQHRCSIRFLRWTDPAARPAQATEDVKFQLTVCT
ncbi:MAG TPA: cell division protein ZapD [Steroidobacteraceae bacterium]|jgi:cell division protein ZapD|nr:cell division protein ZapD [Steroidobacteraceae bacterium]